MNILTGQISMDIGEIFMEGKPVRFSSPKDALKRALSWCSGIESGAGTEHSGKYLFGQ